MQIDDQSCAKKPSSTSNSCLQKMIEKRKVFGFMELVRGSRFVPLVDIQKIRVEVSTRPLFYPPWIG